MLIYIYKIGSVSVFSVRFCSKTEKLISVRLLLFGSGFNWLSLYAHPYLSQCIATWKHSEYCFVIVTMLACWILFPIKSLMNLINSDLEVDYGSEEIARIIYTSLAVDTEVNFVVLLLVRRKYDWWDLSEI